MAGARLRLASIAVLTFALAVLLSAPAASAVPGKARKLTFQVPVSQPDEFGEDVSLATDVYLPRRPAPRRGLPFVVLFHGGGSSKNNPFDAGHAAALARRGFVTMLYTARGHSGSGGQTTIAGPKEIRDAFDTIAWALRRRGGAGPRHRNFRIDRRRIALHGYSQGGLHTNLVEAYAGDRSLNPYGIRFRAIEPAHTPDKVFEALITHGVVKLSYGAGLLATYRPPAAEIAPIVGKWVLAVAADLPALFGDEICDSSGHDTATSTMKADLAARSVGCMVRRVGVPALWVQAFDDGLFPAQMAVSTLRHLPRRGASRLYLAMGGHAAPSARAAVQRDIFRIQIAYLNHFLRNRPLRIPRVIYWARDPAVGVPNGAYAYPPGAWRRRTARAWPPPGTRGLVFRLGSDGVATRGSAAAGPLPLAPLSLDLSNDPVARAALASTPLGSSPLPARLPATSLPGFVAGFSTAPFASGNELGGGPVASLLWTPETPDTQLAVRVFDRAADGRMTLLSRGVQGVRGARPGVAREVRIEGDAFSALVRRGHRIVVWVTAGDSSFYKPYAAAAGGVIAAGNQATLRLPLRRTPRLP